MKDIADINRAALPETTDPDFSFTYVDIGSVDADGNVRVGEEIKFGAAPSRARRLVQGGDSIVSTVRTYLKAIAYIDEGSADCVVSTGFATLTPRPGVHPRFLYWWLRGSVFVEEIVARSVGVSYPAVTASDVGDVVFHLPPLDQQRRIVDLLDKEIARVDALLAEVHHSELMVEERRWLVVAHALAALQPAASLRRGLEFLTDGPFGSAFTSADYSDEGAAVVRLGNIGFAEWRGDDLARIPLQLFDTFRRYQVRAGDLLIASLGDERNHAGRACVAPGGLGPAMVKGKCFCARVDDRVLDAEFAALFLSSPIGAQALSVEARGSTRQMINLEILKAVRLPLPSVSVQRGVVEEAHAEWERSRRITAELSVQRGLLREHRQALITAAVTGGLDAVRKVA